MKTCQVEQKIIQNIIILIFIVLSFIFLPPNYINAAGGADGVSAISASTYDVLFGGGTDTSTLLAGGTKCSLMSDAAADAAVANTPGRISVSDPGVKGAAGKIVCQEQKSGIERTMDQIKSWAIDKALVELKNSGDIAWRQALKFFLNQLAYDTANYLATGDKGQMPMFETEGFGGYLKNAADNTAGAFIESLGKNMATLNFNLASRT